ncbi:metallophosphoesterase [Aestuariivirga litoralis]|uniref:metallophosphoesterase n=1 Tax=Aestuariivirga litoralis TaxID=2650924 RepID=UPI0018C842C3|nr:metallophosphoesterase [Aestuariivirga litoralis]MBG1231260.1 metallophosphoesterase [Aestuariivirga litoralis]
MITRRTFIKSFGAMTAAGLGMATYGVVIEPGFLLNTTAYAFTPPNWTPGLKLRAAVIADPHVVEPWFPLTRWRSVINAVNALEPDIIFMLGDYVSGLKFRSGTVPIGETAKIAGLLRAKLGVYSINGNHDWWGDKNAQRTRQGPPEAQRAFEDNGIPVLSNRALRLNKDGIPFWVTGTDSLVAFRGRNMLVGMADLDGTLAQVTDAAPIIHLAHEPDMFANMPSHVSLTLSGHTHGGQIRIAGYAPYIPSAYGRKYTYGHIIEDGCHLIVSGGLGVSDLPIRFGAPPEINLLELG